jgi:hypothetical protein
MIIPNLSMKKFAALFFPWAAKTYEINVEGLINMNRVLNDKIVSYLAETTTKKLWANCLSGIVSEYQDKKQLSIEMSTRGY